MDYEKEIPFGAFDSELMHQEIFIPEGFEATIDGNKIILKRKDSEDEMIRKWIIEDIRFNMNNEPLNNSEYRKKAERAIAWLEKQGQHKKFRDAIQVGDNVTKNEYNELVNLSQLKRVAKQGQQKLPIEKLPEEMKTIGESLGFTTQEECDEYNQMVSELIMSDKVEPKFKIKYAGREYNVLEIKENMGITWYGIEDEPNHIDYVKANSCEIINVYGIKENGSPYPTKPAIFAEHKSSDEAMKEALRTEYEKGRADAFAQMQKEWSKEDEKMLNHIIGLLEGLPILHNWLKSLKERIGWKPSDEQMEALADALSLAKNCGEEWAFDLRTLLEQLKKLKGH